MGGARKTATTTQNERVTRAVEQEFQAAAASRWGGGAEEFLWRSRRCMEAVLYTLLLEQKADVTSLAESGKGLDELLKQPELKGVIPRQVRDHIEGVKKYGNTGTHFQIDGDVSEASARITASALTEVVQWFCTREERALPAGLAPAFAALADVRQRIPSRHEVDLARERQRADALDQQLRTACDAAPPRDGGAPSRPLQVVGLALCLALTAGSLGFAVGRGSSEPLAAPVETAPRALALPDTIAPPPPTPVAIATTPVVADSPAAPATPVAPPAPAACRDGMVRVDGDAQTPAFCIDAAAVTMGDYRRCVDAGRCPRPAGGTGCNWRNGPVFDANGANCVTHDQALAYCQWRTSGGALPTHAEWQRVRPRRSGVRMLPDTNEWAADNATDGRAWVRGAWNADRFGWTTAPTTQGRRDLGFRCVVR